MEVSVHETLTRSDGAQALARQESATGRNDPTVETRETTIAATRTETPLSGPNERGKGKSRSTRTLPKGAEASERANPDGEGRTSEGNKTHGRTGCSFTSNGGRTLQTRRWMKALKSKLPVHGHWRWQRRQPRTDLGKGE